MVGVLCPPEKELERLFLGGLPEREADVLEQHVLACGDCLKKLKGLLPANDLLSEEIAGRKPDPASTLSPVVDDLIARLSSLRCRSANHPHQESPMISISCSACQKKLSVKDTLAGKKIKCPGCGQVLAVPAQVAAAMPGEDMRTLAPAPAPAPVGQEQRTVPPADPGNAHTESLASKSEATRGGDRPAADHDSSLTDFLSPPQAADELGRLGKYRILEILGHGGMGVVYKAEDPLLERQVALKAMLPTLAASASAGKRFLREAKTLAAVEHDHIVRIYQVDEERGVPFLAMEFLKGEPLDERLKREEKLPLAEVLRIGREIAEGLAAAHQRGLIHRDIKPGNIWLEAPRNRVKILDFGLARATSEDAGLTQQGAIIGTPAYMAPEQGRGDPVDARSDLFSLGVVLYRTCCGQLPFPGTDTVSLLISVATHEPTPPRALNAELPPELSDLVMQLLDKDPAERVASAEAVVELLQALEKRLARQKDGKADTAELTAAGAPPARGKPVSRRRRPLPLVIGALGLLLVGLLGAWAAGLIRFPSDEGVSERHHAVAGKPPGSEGWFKEVAALPTARQVDAVAAKLKERNPGFDGKVTHRIEEGAVTELQFLTHHVADLSPLRALPGLRRLECAGTVDTKGVLDDLSPLVGLKLTALTCSNTKVADLSPLREMQLTALRCQSTNVTDLAPLKGMPLKELACDFRVERDFEMVRSFEALETINGKSAAAFWVDVDTRLAGDDPWLKEMAALPAPKKMEAVIARLKEVNPRFDGKHTSKVAGVLVAELQFHADGITDLSPLRALFGLRRLTCQGSQAGKSQLADLSPLKALKLVNLGVWNTKVSDLSPLKDMKLTEQLNCNYTQVSDLKPLKGMPLRSLTIDGTRVTDLTPLEGMRLTRLTCASTQVSNLAPLKGMPLTYMNLFTTRVSNLTPLAGMPLTTLNLNSTQVSDLSPLKGMPLKALWCDFKPERDAEILRSIKTLETVNGKPAKELLK